MPRHMMLRANPALAGSPQAKTLILTAMLMVSETQPSLPIPNLPGAQGPLGMGAHTTVRQGCGWAEQGRTVLVCRTAAVDHAQEDSP